MPCSELLLAEASDLPASSTKLDPNTTGSQFPFIGNSISIHVWN
ncbi:hypothetical protein [Thermoplasma sp.]|nr:hypothetical protein [Thermoplasma sp.]